LPDYTPKYPQSGKLKKESLGDEWTLELKKTEDILKSIDKDGIIAVGFKAEKDEQKAFESAKRALRKRKNLDGHWFLNFLLKGRRLNQTFWERLEP